jgi:hypothetical protein
MATISNTPRPGYVWDSTDNVWYPIGTGPHTHADYITSGSAINPNIVDAKGDIIAATAADTVARLAVGANGTVLTAASGQATGLEWATPASGGMTSLASGSLAASGTGLDIQSISSSYNELQLYVKGFSIDGANNVTVRFNNNSSGNYAYRVQQTQSSTISSNDGQTSLLILPNNVTGTGTVNLSLILKIPNYKDTTSGQMCEWLTQWNLPGGVFGIGQYKVVEAISRIQFLTTSGNFDAGTYELFGVK